MNRYSAAFCRGRNIHLYTEARQSDAIESQRPQFVLARRAVVGRRWLSGGRLNQNVAIGCTASGAADVSLAKPVYISGGAPAGVFCILPGVGSRLDHSKGHRGSGNHISPTVDSDERIDFCPGRNFLGNGCTAPPSSEETSCKESGPEKTHGYGALDNV